jgi:hypothetical protein
MTLPANDAMSDREHSGVEPMQTPGANSPVDSAFRHAHLPELPPRDHTVLPPRQPSHLAIQQTRLHFAAISDGQSSCRRWVADIAPRLACSGARVLR